LSSQQPPNVASESRLAAFYPIMSVDSRWYENYGGRPTKISYALVNLRQRIGCKKTDQNRGNIFSGEGDTAARAATCRCFQNADVHERSLSLIERSWRYPQYRSLNRPGIAGGYFV